MSLAERIAEVRRPPVVGFDKWVADLPEDDRTLLLEAAADPRITHRDLLAVVKAEGATVGRDRLTDWRKANGFPR